MRPLELVILLGALSVLIALAAPRARRWARPGAALAILVLGAHLLAEGWRWQMVPLYALVGTLALTSLLMRARPPERVSASRKLAVMTGTGLGALGLAFAAALPAIVPVFRLPPPDGPYEIGTLTYHWIDTDRGEVFTDDPDDRREIMAQVWYPAQDSAHLPRAPYVPREAGFEPLARLLGLPGFFFSHLRRVDTNAAEGAPTASDQDSFPVLVFLHGRGGFRQHNMFQVEQMVSHGYIVAAIDLPYAASEVIFPDGRRAEFDARMLQRAFVESVIGHLAGDAAFALDKLAELNDADPHEVLTGRLDVERAGLFGASLGGMATGEACRVDPRFRACLIMDAFMTSEVVEAGLIQPAMWITRDAEVMELEGWAPADVIEHTATIRAVFDGLPGDGYLVFVDGMFHSNIADFPLMLSGTLAQAAGAIGPADWRRVHDAINAYSLAFFDKHVKQAPAPLLDEPQAHSSARLETRGR